MTYSICDGFDVHVTKQKLIHWVSNGRVRKLCKLVCTMKVILPDQRDKIYVATSTFIIFVAVCVITTVVWLKKTGHIVSREGISWDTGQYGRKTGCPGKYRTGGNPSHVMIINEKIGLMLTWVVRTYVKSPMIRCALKP